MRDSRKTHADPRTIGSRVGNRSVDRSRYKRILCPGGKDRPVAEISNEASQRPRVASRAVGEGSRLHEVTGSPLLRSEKIDRQPSSGGKLRIQMSQQTGPGWQRKCMVPAQRARPARRRQELEARAIDHLGDGTTRLDTGDGRRKCPAVWQRISERAVSRIQVLRRDVHSVVRRRLCGNVEIKTILSGVRRVLIDEGHVAERVESVMRNLLIAILPIECLEIDL